MLRSGSSYQLKNWGRERKKENQRFIPFHKVDGENARPLQRPGSEDTTVVSMRTKNRKKNRKRGATNHHSGRSKKKRI